jgi:hypothetical protein
MKIKPTNAYKHLGTMYHTVKIVSLISVHVSATFVAIFRVANCKGRVTRTLMYQ